MKIYVVRSDYGRYTDSFKTNGYVGIGWFTSDPFNKKWELTDKQFLKDKYKEKYPTDPYMRMNQNVGQIYRFINDIKVDDIIISPHNTTNLLMGRVKSELYYEKDDTSRYEWRRKVDWLKDNIDRNEFSQPLQNTLRSSLTCFEVKHRDEIFELLGIDVPKNRKQPDFNVKSLYNGIKNHLLELDPTEFELLVSYLLRTLGFEPTQETGGVGDGGIDFEGVLDVQGIASINLQVQVKRYHKSTIGEREIRNFRGSLKKDFQGCFITLSKFQNKAIKSANNKDMERIQLIDGMKFTELFIEQYDEIIEVIISEENEELLDKIRFKKTLLPI